MLHSNLLNRINVSRETSVYFYKSMFHVKHFVDICKKKCYTIIMLKKER